MSHNYIDRDGYQMIRFGQDAKEIVDQMENNVRITEGVLDACSSRLDDNTRKKIAELHDCCENFRRQFVTFRHIAEMVEDKGRKINMVRGL